jgi:hypothetical protein
MTTNQQSTLIDQIIDEFNFERVLIAMTALDWHWQTTEGNGMAIPNIAKLKATARYLLTNAIKSDCTGTGGFEARYFKAEGNSPEYFTLKFVVSEACTWDD